MSDFKLVHSGFDKFDAALQGALNPELFPLLHAAKENAQRYNQSHLLTIGPGSVDVLVSDRGMRSGYAFHLDTGSLGANFFIKEQVDLTGWNLFIASRAEALLAHGFRDHFRQNIDALKGMGATVGIESINRIDFAMDFVTRDFRLVPEQFVAPARTRKRIDYGPASRPDGGPTVLIEGRDVQSVTIGRMPGRQVIVYDKRAEALVHKKMFWFEAWGVDPADPDVQVFRVELRAGKHHLKEDWGLSTFRDIEDSAADVFVKMAEDVRYIEPLRVGENITRAPLNAFWAAVRGGIGRVLADHRSGICPGRIIEIERARKREVCLDNIAGNAATLAVVDGMPFEQATEQLPGAVQAALHSRFEADPTKLAQKMDRVQKQHRFIVEPVSQTMGEPPQDFPGWPSK